MSHKHDKGWNLLFLKTAANQNVEWSWSMNSRHSRQVLNFNVKLGWMAVEHWKHSFQYKHMHSSGIQQVSTSCQECGSASQLQGYWSPFELKQWRSSWFWGGLALWQLEPPESGWEAGFHKCPCLHHLSDWYCSWHMYGANILMSKYRWSPADCSVGCTGVADASVIEQLTNSVH